MVSAREGAPAWVIWPALLIVMKLIVVSLSVLGSRASKRSQPVSVPCLYSCHYIVVRPSAESTTESTEFENRGYIDRTSSGADGDGVDKRAASLSYQETPTMGW